MVFLDIDGGSKGVIDRFIAEGKDIIRPVEANGDPIRFRHHDASSQDEWERTWERFKECFFDATNKRDVRTIVVDTETEMYELVRLAKLGRTEQVKERYYGSVNADMRKVIQVGKDSDKNIIFTRKVKNVYIGDKRQKEFEGAGFSGTEYEAEAVVRAWKGSVEDPNTFGFTFQMCRLRTELENVDNAMHVLTEPMNTFQFLAATVFPDTTPEEWE
jgi:hypothetical protein